MRGFTLQRRGLWPCPVACPACCRKMKPVVFDGFPVAEVDSSISPCYLVIFEASENAEELLPQGTFNS